VSGIREWVKHFNLIEFFGMMMIYGDDYETCDPSQSKFPFLESILSGFSELGIFIILEQLFLKFQICGKRVEKTFLPRKKLDEMIKFYFPRNFVENFI
jgi:hypothetical protein